MTTLEKSKPVISVLLPTRGRPQNLERLALSILTTATEPQLIELVYVMDIDDPEYENYPAELPINNISLAVKERMVLSEYWNVAFDESSGDILMHCGDDIIFRTEGWDEIVREAFEQYPDNIVFVFGKDGSPHDGNFGTHGFIHRKWAETVGYFVPPYFSSDYNDTWLNDVARMIGRHHHIDILTEHMHPDLGKAEYDITHQERIERHQRDNVAQLYDSKLDERRADAEKLKEVMQ